MRTFPKDLFGREREWRELSDFAKKAGDQNRLAIVLGRRRQGKSMLVRHIQEATGGFYFEAAQQTSSQNLADFSRAWSQHRDSAGTSFESWGNAVEHLAALQPRAKPFVIVLDEFGYLATSAPELPSLLQRLFTERPAGGLRVILCGSAFAQMKRLLSPDAPLRGRQNVTVQINPFDFRTAADFWGLRSNPQAAFRHHALIGGTPAYRRFTTDAPLADGDVDAFMTRYLLDPSSVMYGEGRSVVAEDDALEDKSLYWGVLNAVAEGASRRSEIAKLLNRPDSALHVPIEALVAAALLEKRPDPFNRRASTLVLTEPVLRTERILLAPERARIERRRGADVWADAQPRLSRRVYGPHLEWMAAEWMLSFASSETVGGELRSAGPGIIMRQLNRSQIDVVGVAPDRDDVERICTIGECKAGAEPVGLAELERLDTEVALLGKRTMPVTKRLLFGRSGFTAELQRFSRKRPDVELIDLQRLYHGK
jgi:uncharacterized protein